MRATQFIRTVPSGGSSRCACNNLRLYAGEIATVRRRLRSIKSFSNAAESAGSYKIAIPGIPQANALRPVGYWLLGTGAVVAGMVTVGGITRLTRSGLSMTDWKIQGSLPPITQADWEEEFEQYKQFPEFQQRKNMTLDDFKFIFWWEYGHRMLGRLLGVIYVGPLAYFAIKGSISRSLYLPLSTLLALGGTQGLIGWWMVKSGLEMSAEQQKEIRVSPYRLATHLGMAFTTFTLLTWTGLRVLSPPEQLVPLLFSLNKSSLSKLRSVRGLSLASAAILGTTILSGAFVAGNDAGHAYNTFPKMGDNWIPEETWERRPFWRNFFENTATVQLDHRVLALSTLGLVLTTYVKARNPAVWSVLPANTRTALNASAGMVVLQVCLGISTLLLYVPIPLAAAHQAGSLTLLGLLTWTNHSLRFVKSVRPAAEVLTRMKG